MATPWIQIGNLVLRNLDTILGVVAPAFTRKKAAQISEQAEVMATQIAELQAAVSSNADQVKQLAEQLKQVVKALEEAALEAAADRERTRTLCLLAVGMSLLAIIAVTFLVFAR